MTELAVKGHKHFRFFVTNLPQNSHTPLGRRPAGFRSRPCDSVAQIFLRKIDYIQIGHDSLMPKLSVYCQHLSDYTTTVSTVAKQLLVVLSVSQSLSQSVRQSLSQSVNLSVSQSVRLSVSQSVNLSVSQSVSLSVSQSVNLSVSQSVTQSISQSLSQSVSQPNSQGVSQSILQFTGHDTM